MHLDLDMLVVMALAHIFIVDAILLGYQPFQVIFTAFQAGFGPYETTWGHPVITFRGS